MAVEREQAADVDAERPGEVVIRQGEALNHVADARFHDRQPEMRPEAAVSDDMDAGDLCAAEIERDPVRLAVIEGGEQSFA